MSKFAGRAPHPVPAPLPPPPASAAWRLGDPPGRRRFFHLATDRAFALEGGGLLSHITIAYETWGTLDAAASNAVLVCHALTGDSHVSGEPGPGHPTTGWWDAIVGPGRAIDTEELYVVCANVLGGCQGSTGPASPDPATGRPYGSRFPVVSVRDMVRAQAALASHLGVRRWLTVVGGSMGGMQVLEWGVTYPDRVRSLIPVATCTQATAQQIAWGAVGRQAIRLDPNWRGGDYYDAPPGEGPHRGLAVARMLAQITYRSDDVFTDRFGREMEDPHAPWTLWERFEVERYLDYHGDKLVRRFDANSYLVITKAMDLHDVGRGRGGLVAALARVGAPVLNLSISSDTLYPPYQQRQTHALVAANGVRSEHVMIESPHGHDGFLIEAEAVGALIADFIDSVYKDDYSDDCGDDSSDECRGD